MNSPESPSLPHGGYRKFRSYKVAEALAMRTRLATDHTPRLPPAPVGSLRLTGLSGLADFVERAAPELAANAMLCAGIRVDFKARRVCNEEPTGL